MTSLGGRWIFWYLTGGASGTVHARVERVSTESNRVRHSQFLIRMLKWAIGRAGRGTLVIGSKAAPD
jgi:hypothetical protein